MVKSIDPALQAHLGNRAGIASRVAVWFAARDAATGAAAPWGVWNGDDDRTFTVDGVVFDYGAFINAAITFVLTAAAVYFLVVVPYNTLRERRSRGQEDEVEPTNEEKMVALLERIADKG